MSLCLVGAGKTVQIAVAAFTLAWTHTVERTRWEEDWQVLPEGLMLVEARVEATGAGMEPPPEARFDGRWWHWRPSGMVLPQLVLRRAPGAGDWRFCTHEGCQEIGSLLDSDPVTLSACEDGGPRR